jgi:hypothetical protein
MRTIPHAEGGGGGPKPVAAPRVRHPARHALLIVLLLLAAFAGGALAAIALQVVDDMQEHGQMDPTR